RLSTPRSGRPPSETRTKKARTSGGSLDVAWELELPSHEIRLSFVFHSSFILFFTACDRAQIYLISGSARPMAKLTKSIASRLGLSGMIGGQIVIRRRRDGSCVVAAAPRKSSRRATRARRAQQERFRDAVRFAQTAKDRREYQEAARAQGRSAY